MFLYNSRFRCLQLQQQSAQYRNGYQKYRIRGNLYRRCAAVDAAATLCLAFTQIILAQIRCWNIVNTLAGSTNWKICKIMNMNKCSVAVNGTSIMQNVLVLQWSVLPKSNPQTAQFGNPISCDVQNLSTAYVLVDKPHYYKPSSFD